MIVISLKYDPDCLDLVTFSFHQPFHFIAAKTFVVIEALCEPFLLQIFSSSFAHKMLYDDTNVAYLSARLCDVAEPQN
jgi:hypothetical protein